MIICSVASYPAFCSHNHLYLDNQRTKAWCKDLTKMPCCWRIYPAFLPLALFPATIQTSSPIRSSAASFTYHVHITKQGTPNLITEVHYILATISLKFRARITKFQADVPEVLKNGISLVRLIFMHGPCKAASEKALW